MLGLWPFGVPAVQRNNDFVEFSAAADVEDMARRKMCVQMRLRREMCIPTQTALEGFI